MHCSFRLLAVTLAFYGLLAAPAHAQPSSIDRWTGLELKELQTIYVRDTANRNSRTPAPANDSLVILVDGVGVVLNSTSCSPAEATREERHMIDLAVSTTIGLLAGTV
jgi:hypothetical protein